MRRGRPAVQLELSDLRYVIEHRRELPRHRLDLLLAQLKTRQARNVENLTAVDHWAAFYGAPSRRSVEAVLTAMRAVGAAAPRAAVEAPKAGSVGRLAAARPMAARQTAGTLQRPGRPPTLLRPR